MKRIVTLCLALLLVLALVPGVQAAKTELIVSMQADAENTDWFQQGVAAFQAEYPDVEVILEPHEGISARSKFVSAAYAGNAPDVLLANLYWVKDFAMSGWLTPLDDYITEADRNDHYQDFINYATVDGKLYGIFNGTDVATIIYRKSMLAEAGIEVPALDKAMTWDEFFAAAQKLTRDTNANGTPDVWGAGIIGHRSGATTYTNFPLFFMLGGELIAPDGTPAFNTAAAQGACQFYHDLIYKYQVAPKESYSYDNTALLSSFNAGQYAMLLGASYMVRDLEAQFPGDVGVMLYPTPDANVPSEGLSGGWMYTIMAQEKDRQDLAGAFINCMITTEMNVARYNANGQLPVRASAFEAVSAAAEQESPNIAEWMTVFAKQMENTNLKPGDAIYDIIQDEYTIALQEVMMDNLTPEAAMQAAYDNTIKRANEAGILK